MYTNAILSGDSYINNLIGDKDFIDAFAGDIRISYYGIYRLMNFIVEICYS